MVSSWHVFAIASVGAVISTVPYLFSTVGWSTLGFTGTGTSTAAFNTTALPRLPLAAVDVATHRTPFVVSGHPTVQWPDSSRELVCGAVDTLSGVCVCRKGVDASSCDMFYVAGRAPILRETNVSLISPYAVQDLSCDEFYDAVADPIRSAPNTPDEEPGAAVTATRQFTYYSRAVNKTSEDLWPVVAPLVTPELEDLSPRVNLWLGSAGTTARMHFDSSANLFTQVSGRKRFLLMSPIHFHRLYMFSRQHPGHRQAQLDPDGDVDVLASRFPNFRRKYVQEVVLEPGQTLFIPPFYFHHVTALEPSVAVNVYLHSQHKLTLQLLDRVVPRLPETVPGASFDDQLYFLAVTLRLFLADVIKAVHVNLHTAMKAALAVPSRSGFVPRTRPIAGSINSFVKNMVLERHSHHAWDPLVDWPAEAIHPHPDVVMCPPDANRTGIDNSLPVQDAVGLFSLLPLDSQEMFLADFVEAKATAALNSTLARAFFIQCFPVAA